MHAYTNILVPSDFEAQSIEALKVAGSLACSFDAKVTVVHVHDANGYQAPAAYVTYTQEERKEIADYLQERLSDVVLELRATGVRGAQSQLLAGEPVAELLRFAREGKFDLIVMGTHGRTGVWQKLIGSIAQQMLSEAPCPVLTVRAYDPEQTPRGSESGARDERTLRLVGGASAPPSPGS
jgi:nucleotide-binding universal stress UspA family protein